MRFDKDGYTIKTYNVGGESVECLCYMDLVYVDNPVNPEFQSMNIFAPAAYRGGGAVNGYTRRSAPIFMPNTVGGYMPGPKTEPGLNRFGPPLPNPVFRALRRGYVAVCPAIRGRSQPRGKAPACVTDYKAAARYLRRFAQDIPGNVERIVTNGTSAGGALSALMGATGNDPAYDTYLEEIGAARERDDVFAASCYCPIINLENADAAYEWQFLGVNDYHRMNIRMGEGGRPTFTPEDGVMSFERIALSLDLARLFPAYVNGLRLARNGDPLTLDMDGDGPFKEYIKSVIVESAQRAIDRNADIPGADWLAIDGGRVTGVDFAAYARSITRMKTAPAFDGLSLESPENNLFGDDAARGRHFTLFSYTRSKARGERRDPSVVRLMNPMEGIVKEGVTLAKYWRVRHGEADRDTSLAISAMLALKLTERGCAVDYHAPWAVPRAGDYDLDEMFAWIDDACAQEDAAGRIA
ncbi:MAG: alpha/beta hydrolase [Oscillospiraceae bacterium]|jgi:hypothetical protein|nr:alpha/beta hydrolase [Oscillospiraceae bacterium]